MGASRAAVLAVLCSKVGRQLESSEAVGSLDTDLGPKAVVCEREAARSSLISNSCREVVRRKESGIRTMPRQ